MTDVLMNDSTADISTTSQAPNQSMSTDSEESFLIKQLNKSQLFNNTQSSGTTGSNSGGNNTQRRSFFRESYLDDDGALKSFSVYQDVINETSDDSRDISLSGLSSLNMENVITGREPQNSHLNSILNEVDANQATLGHRKTASVSRTDSLRDPRKTSKRMSGSSFRISAYATLPLNSNPNSHSNTNTNSNSNSNSNAHTGSTTGSEPHLSSSGGSAANFQPTNPRSSSFYSALNLPGPTPRLSDLELEHPVYNNLERVPTPDYAAPPPPSSGSDERQSVSSIYDNEITLNAMTGSIQSPKKQASSSSLGSYKSARSLARASILNFEETRRKQKGTPHLIAQSGHNARVQSHDTPEQILSVSDDVNALGVTPSIHSPSSEEFNGEVVDDISIRNTKRAKMYSGQSLVKKEMGLKEFKLRPPSVHGDIPPAVVPYYNKDQGGEYPSDTLFEKLHHERDNRPEKYRRDTHSLAWTIYFVSFLVPPLFFFLGLGLLDSHLGPVDIGLKRISMLTGTIVLMVTLAMIGVGFGVGITQAGD